MGIYLARICYYLFTPKILTPYPYFCVNIFAQIKTATYICNVILKTPAQVDKVGNNIMATIENLIGKTIVGYRYGEAPESGYSWNYAENRYEPGVSMAQVGYFKECGSFATSEAESSRRKYYYIGEIAGEGGDDEICLTNVKRITYKEYLKLRTETKQVSNDYVNAICDRKLRLIDRGINICMSADEVESLRAKYTK